MLVLLLFFLVCAWKALTNHTCFAVMCCPRATQCRQLSGNPMPATPNSWRRCATAQSSTAHSQLCEKNKQQAPPATTGAVKRLPLPRCQEEDAFATAVATAATTVSRGTSCLRDQATTTGGPQVTTQGIDDAYLGDANEVYGNLRYV